MPRNNTRGHNKPSVLSVLLMTLLLMTALSLKAEPEYTLKLGSGSESGAYHAFVSRLKQLAAPAGLEIENRSTAGSEANLEQIQQGALDAAIVQNDTAYYRYYDKQQPNRSFGTALPLFPEYFQIILRKDANITHIEELRGKRIALGARGSGTYRNARDVLKAADINFTPYPSNSLDQALGDLLAGKVDAVCHTAASPPPALTKPGSPLTLLPLSDSLVQHLVQQHPYYYEGQMPVAESEFITSISLMAYLVLSNSLPDTTARSLLDSMLDNWVDLSQPGIYQLIPQDSLRRAVQRKPVPLHDGARAVLQDRGYLIDPWMIAWYLLGLGALTIITFIASQRLTTRHDRLGNLQPIRCLWRYQFTLFVQGLAVLITTLTLMALAYFGIMLFIQQYEARYATDHNLYNPFATMTIPDLMLWLWGWIGGYDSGMFPQSTMGKILVVFPPLVGLFSIGWLVFRFWRNIAVRKLAEQMGIFVPPLSDHVLLCGWNEKARGIIFGLTSPYAPERKKIVVVAEMDDEKPLQKFNFPKGMVHYYRGDSSDSQALNASHIYGASAALILAGEKKKLARNIGSVLTTLAIKRMSPQIFAVAELRHEENMQRFEACAIDALVFADTIVYRLAAQACFNPLGVSWFFDMITHDEHAELYAIPWKKVRGRKAWATARALFQKKRNLVSLYTTVKLYIRLKINEGHPPNEGTSYTANRLLNTMANAGLSLIAIYHPQKDFADMALVQHTFTRNRYTHFVSAGHDNTLAEDDILIYTAMEKEDIFFPFSRKPAQDDARNHLPPPRTGTNQQHCEVLLLGNLEKCLGVINEIRHLKNLQYRVITDSEYDPLALNNDNAHGIDDLLNHASLETHLGRHMDVIIILADTPDTNAVCLDQDRGELDGKTLLIARHIRKCLGDRCHPMIIAEMLGRNSRDLFIGAGIDVVLPRSLLVERLMTKMAYGYGVVSNYLMAALALNDDVFLQNITLAGDDADRLDLAYEELLLRMPRGVHLLAIAPADEKLTELLRNKYQDFEQHYIACPAQGKQLDYRSAPGDTLLVLGGNEQTTNDRE